MYKKKSLGYSPVGRESRETFTYSFIPDLNSRSDQDGSGNRPPAKKVASYYLDERVIRKVREMGQKSNQSYSRIVNRALLSYIED